MESERKKISGQEKDEASIRLLEKLQDQLNSHDASNRRRAAFNLSWMQEDGLEILKGALFGDFHVTAKNAAAYGLRKMRGRMRKMALEAIEQGLKCRDGSTREVCRNALQLLGQKVNGGAASRPRAARSSRIKEIPKKGRPRRSFSIRRTHR